MLGFGRVASAFVLCGLICGAAQAADPEDPDWPCIQRKVPAISAGMMWVGPEVDEDDRSWQSALPVADLAHRLAQRRTPIEEAEEEIDRFAAESQGERNAQLTLLFTALLQIVNVERGDIMAGIER